jgi:hypothetical protein
MRDTGKLRNSDSNAKNSKMQQQQQQETHDTHKYSINIHSTHSQDDEYKEEHMNGIPLDDDDTEQHEQIVISDSTLNRKTTPREWIAWFIQSQILAHSLLFFNQVLFAGFGVIGPQSLKHFNSVLFASMRTMIMTIGIIPLMIIIDRNHTFRPDLDKRVSWKNFLLSKLPHGKELILLASEGIVLSLCIYTYIIAVGLTSFISSKLINVDYNSNIYYNY